MSSIINVASRTPNKPTKDCFQNAVNASKKKKKNLFNLNKQFVYSSHIFLLVKLSKEVLSETTNNRLMSRKCKREIVL